MEIVSLDRALSICGLVVGILTFVIGLGVAIALDSRTEGEMHFSIVCFVVSAVALLATVGAWAYFLDARQWIRVLVASISGALVMGCLVSGISWVRGRHEDTVESVGSAEEPTFSENVTTAEFTLGTNGITARYSLKLLRTHPQHPFGFSQKGAETYNPIILYVEGNRLFVDVRVSGPKGESPIEIKHNKFTVRLSGWDRNSNRSAFEVVNGQEVPVFQMIYLSDYHVQINGFISAPGVLFVADDNGLATYPLRPPFIMSVPYSLKRLFKYPSWKYPGQFQ
jgi:hypothetical protein